MNYSIYIIIQDASITFNVPVTLVVRYEYNGKNEVLQLKTNAIQHPFLRLITDLESLTSPRTISIFLIDAYQYYLANPRINELYTML